MQAAWVAVATRTHEQLLALIEDEGRFVRTGDGKIYLDLRPIIVELGEQIAPIGRLEEQLPPAAGRIELIDADQLETVQTAVRVLRALAAWLWVLALLVAALAIWLAAGRRRLELRALGIGLLVVGVLLLFTRQTVGTYLVDELTSDATQPAGSNAWNILTQALADRAWVWIALGVIVLVGTWLVGPAGLAARARVALRPVAASLVWTYGLVAGLMVVLATFLPAFQRSLLAGLVFLVLLVAGVEVVRRFVLSDTMEALPAEVVRTTKRRSKRTSVFSQAPSVRAKRRYSCGLAIAR